MDRPIVPTQIRRAFDGRVFSVTVESIILPRGDALDAEIVRHPGSAVLIPVLGDGSVILVRQYRHAIGQLAWELPAGSLKHGEDPRAAAGRECQEETGLIPQQLVRLGALYPSPGYCDEEMHFFVATDLRHPSSDDAPARCDDDEDIEAQPFALDDLERMIADGAIVDMKTVAGVALYRGFQARR
jgi:ADP-ribose pyrophosphatase